MTTTATTGKSATHALRNAYLFMATPISVYAGYEGYKHSNSYLTKYPDPSTNTKKWCFIPERLRQPIYVSTVKSAWTVGSAASGLLFPITIPLYLHHVQTSTTTTLHPFEEVQKMKDELEE